MAKVEWHYDHSPNDIRRTEVPAWMAEDDDGKFAAAEIADAKRREDFEQFTETETTIVIRSPKSISGVYLIYLEYVPDFTAYRDDDASDEYAEGETQKNAEHAA